MSFLPPTLPPSITTVCCDYFDSIVTRVIAPEDVKRQWASRIKHIIDLDDKFPLCSIRAKIEYELCKKNSFSGLDSEFNIQKCYQLIWEAIQGKASIGLKEFVKTCLQVELSIECLVQKVDKDVLNWLIEVKSSGKRIILVSDFYFPENIFREMLRHHQIESLFERIYISADSFLTKRSGRLYEHILSHTEEHPDTLFMIGDNLESDYRQPMKYGIHSFHLDRTKIHREYERSSKYSGDTYIISKKINEAIKSTSKTPFPEVALTLFTFIERLYATLLRKGIKDVFFLAREGEFLKKIFDFYASRRCPTGVEIIRSHYFIASRRSTFLPSLGPLAIENFDFLFRQYHHISGREFILSLGLESYLEVIEDSFKGYDFDEKKEDFSTCVLFEKLRKSALFENIYETERLKRRETFLAYLDNFERLQKNNVLCIVDVGWKGTIQDNIFSIFSQVRDVEKRPIQKIEGLYLGLVSAGNINPNNNKEAILYSGIGTRTKYYSIFNENRSLFEVILGASHGSALTYQYDPNGKASPILSSFEEELLFTSHIQPLQEKLFTSISHIDTTLSRTHYNHNWLLAVSARHHARMVFKPNFQEISWFINLFHIENFGVFQKSNFDIQNSKRGIMAKLRFTLQFMRSRGRINLGFWPWLSCKYQGGHLLALAYRFYHLVKAATIR